MSTTVTLRRWQRDALIAFADRPTSEFLAVACPGAGKTTFALAALRAELGGQPRPIVVCVPTAHLKHQWAHAAAGFGLHLEPEWRPDEGIPIDMHGIIVTYAQAASAHLTLATFVRDGVVVLDEIHHAADDRAWGDGVRRAFEPADVRLLLSGTPFRSDDNPIPFVRYSYGDHGEAICDYEYGYGAALEDGGVVRPVYFPRFDGHMEWMDASGSLKEATFADGLTRDDWSARLRTALDVDGNWISTILRKADARLTKIRAGHPHAGGLVIAIDHEHARGIASLLEAITGEAPGVVLSDDPRANRRIEEFAESDDRWIVAVRMISEGVDIPRLRVAVFATTTTTALFFRQAVGRVARWTPGLTTQPAYFFVPDDHRLRGHAATIAVERRHSVENRATAEPPPPSADLDDAEQMSLFSAIGSTVVEADYWYDGLDDDEPIVHAGAAELVGHAFTLPPPPPLAGREIVTPTDALASVRAQFVGKKELRERNSNRVQTLARLLNWEHRAVNAELNRRSDVFRITEATSAQLEERVRHADLWLDELTGR